MLFSLGVLITSCGLNKTYMERTSESRAIPPEFNSNETTIIIELFGHSALDRKVKRVMSKSEYSGDYVYLEKEKEEEKVEEEDVQISYMSPQRDTSKNNLIDTAFPDKEKFRYVLGHQMRVSKMIGPEGYPTRSTTTRFYVYDRQSDIVYWPTVGSSDISPYLKAYLINLEKQNK